jgi:hypothetical protein
MSRESERKFARSGNKLCEVCNEPRLLVEHHIHGREIIGWDRGWNRCWICTGCHDLIHMGRIILEERATTTSGDKLLWHKKGEENVAFEDATPPLYGQKK